MIENLLLGGGIAAAGAIGVSVIGYKRLSGVMPFLFANARIQARGKSTILEPGNSLADKKSLSELASLLSDTDYSVFFEKNPSLRELHRALEKSVVEKAVELYDMSPKNFQKVLVSYTRFYEAKILKAFYRSRFFPNFVSSVDEKLIFPVNEIDSGIIQRLQETKTLADVNTVMASTSYAPVFAKEYEFLEDFEVALDNFVFSKFTGMLEKLKMYDKKSILELLNMKFDIINMLVLIKSIVRKVEKDKRKELLIQNKGFLTEKINALTEAESLKELAEASKGTLYAGTVANAFEQYEKDSSLFHFEVELYRLFKEKMLGAELYHIQGPYPLFSYLLRKELEVKNIMIASKGIESGFEKEEIAELLI